MKDNDKVVHHHAHSSLSTMCVEVRASHHFAVSAFFVYGLRSNNLWLITTFAMDTCINVYACVSFSVRYLFVCVCVHSLSGGWKFLLEFFIRSFFTWNGNGAPYPMAHKWMETSLFSLSTSLNIHSPEFALFLSYNSQFCNKENSFRCLIITAPRSNTKWKPFLE